MKRLPEDFRINILLPGAVWLLASAFIGRSVVARMGADTITVILFAVVTLVVFTIPMAVYMEYRGKMKEYLSRRKRQSASPTAIGRRTTEEPDATGQTALKGGKTLVLLDALRREGFLDAEYRPCKGRNATQMAFIASSVAAICNISYQWKTFGEYWGLPNLRQLLAAKDRRGSKMEKEDIIIDLFRKTAEADGEICGTDAYRRWLKSVRG